jgi:pimeloyl-ACP methyl ester carboxylesterase
MRVTWDQLLHPGDADRFFERTPLPAFEPEAADFAPANAWWLAELSRIVYRRDLGETAAALRPLRRELLQQVGWEELEFFRVEATGSAALLLRTQQPSPCAVLVFRGTEQEIQDFMHDADTLPVPAFNGSVLVHRGFKRALNSLWTPIAAALDRLDCPVFYTGHSLGAALATLAAARRPPHAVYTFGSPRVGDRRLVARLAAVPVFRVVHGSDLVTTVPPEILGFRHAGNERRIGNTARRPLQFDAADLWNRLTTPIDALADHAPISYVSVLKSL